MTPMGHSLIGLSFASLALSTPKNATNHRWRNCGVALTFVALANLPDWPLPNWGHDRYDVSHSIFVNAGLICTVIAVMKTLATGKWFSQPRFLMLAAMAWLSHLLLDSFYNHGRGIAIYWPVSSQRLNLAIPWFSNWDLSQPVTSPDNLSVFGIEFLAYTPILLGSLLVSYKIRNRRASNEA